MSATDPDDRSPYRFYEAFNRRDFATMAGMYPDDVEFVDRRPGLSSTIVGRDAQMAQLRVMADLGMYQLPNVVLAARGPLKLLEVTWSNRDDEAPVEVPTLLFLEYGANGLIKALSVWDPTDVEAALAMLEDRHAQLEGH